MKTLLRWLARGAFVLLAVPLLLLAWVGVALITTQPQVLGERRVDGLAAAARIVRDEHGVPHIFAANDHDAYFALGYAHAQDRFFQMDMTRRAAQGRLAELLGDLALRNDAQTRIKGLHRVVAAQTRTLSPSTRAILQAYADGVNARLKQGGGSAEHRMLLMRVEPWRVGDSVAIAVALTDLLTSGEQFDVAHARLSNHLTPAQLDGFFPPYPTWARDSLGAVMATSATISAEPASPGSNAWALAGTRTKTGKPIVAGDPHLGFSAPAQFYLAHLKLKESARTGFTIPGAPFLVFGHNGDLAWAVTNNEIDAADITPAAEAAVSAAKQRAEIIRVRMLLGPPREVRIVARDTDTGPLLDRRYFNLSAFGDQTVRYRDLALDPDNDVVDALAAINAARTMDEFSAALGNWCAPLVHILAASREGDIALFAAGDPPLRDGAGGWTGRAEPAARLALRDPPSGALAAANNIARAEDIGMYGAFDASRVTRIHELVGAGDGADVESAVSMQTDVVSPFAKRVLPQLLRAKPTTAPARAALALLRRWDGAMDADRPEPLIFAAWIEALSHAVYADELGDDLYEIYAGPRLLFLENVIVQDDARWCDNRVSRAIESCADLLAPALETALAKLRRQYGPDMRRWRWAAAHHAHFPHALMTAAPVLNTLFDARTQIGGGVDTIDIGAYVHGYGFTAIHGPIARAVFDLDDLDRSRFILAPGQSGHPLSRHYRDLVQRWAANDGFELRDDWDALTQPPSARVLTLKPR